MNPILLENFFTCKELSELRKYIYNKFYFIEKVNKPQQEVYPNGVDYDGPALISNEMGRINMYINLSELPEVFKKVNDFMKSINPKIEYFYTTFARYSPLYGQPNLGPHMDSNFESIVTLDVQISNNCNWNMNVEGIEYDMNYNTALIFNPAETVHWRPKKIFKSNEFVEILLIDYIDINNKLAMPEEERRNLAYPWFKVYDL